MEGQDQNRVRCVMWEITDQEQFGLRRYVFSKDADTKCPSPKNHGYHQAMVTIGTRASKIDPEGYRSSVDHDHNDPRWPTTCECGLDLSNEVKQTFIKILYRNTETGEMLPLDDLPAGGMWDAMWKEKKANGNRCGADGSSIHVRLPDGSQWCIDSRANNCTMPEDKVHRCWIRHGVPPVLTVNKQGHTCAAGAGSIVGHRGYHGFLTDGYLVKC